MEKTCSKCGEQKPISDFGPNGSGRTRAACNACERIRNRKRYKPKSENAAGEKKPRRNISVISEARCSICGVIKPCSSFSISKSGKVSSRCKPCQAEASRQYRNENREKIAAYKKRYKKEKRELVLEQKRRHRERHKDKIREKDREYREKNAAKRRAYASMRRAELERATPLWADIQAINAIYDEAYRRSKETGIAYEVDHIVPLRGEKACGLHVHQNLRVITAKENREKSNKPIEIDGVEYF